MLNSLSEKLNNVFDKLRKRGSLSEKDIDLALREIRVALLEADVALPVIRSFTQDVKKKALGEEVVRSVTPGQMVVKIVSDALISVLTSEGSSEIDLAARPPVVIMLVGLQGAGKTTTCAKLAKFLKEKKHKNVMMVSLDTQRPAAREQLRILGKQVGIDTFPIDKGENPEEIAAYAFEESKLKGYDVLLVDTAGRLHIDDALMAEVAKVKKQLLPKETILVADAMTGQDAAQVAKSFQDVIGVTGLILSRMDGDARGGAALSMRAIANVPIKFMGTGEKMDQLESFDAQRVANRILDMGDVVALVEKAADAISEEETQKLAKRMEAGKFDLNDMQAQIIQMNKMGGMNSFMGMMPGMKKIKEKISESGLDDKVINRQVAIIQSMTPGEKRKPDMLNASRKRRIAAGCGMSVQDVNRLLKQWKDMSSMMKKFKKLGKKGLLRQGISGLMSR